MRALLAPEVAIVEDDPQMLEMICDFLTYKGVRTQSYASPAAFLADHPHAEADSLRLLITDLTLPGMNGIELAAEAKRTHPGLSVVVISASSSAGVERRAAELGARAVFQKPFGLDSFFRAIAPCLGIRPKD
jgi:two-component system response regulator YesN